MTSWKKWIITRLTDVIYDAIYADPSIIYEIFDLPSEEEIPFSVLDFTDDESLKESAIDWLEDEYGWLINHINLTKIT